MRYILIDLSSDNYLQQPNLFGGYEGEHNETILQVKLPKRMIDIECSGYRFDFQTSEDNKISSPLIPISELNNDILSFHLTQQLTIAGKLLFNVIAILSDENTVSMISKTNTVTLRIEDAVDGNMQLIDPNGYKDELQKMVDERIMEINPANVDQTYSPDSENAQSGKAVAEAVSDKQDSLVSGTNIKTINNQSILGSGNITIEGGSDVEVDQIYLPTSDNAQSGKSVAEAVATEQNRADNTFANALKGTASGTSILIDDVSPVTHEMGVKVKGKNLITFPYTYGGHTYGVGDTYTHNGVTFTVNADRSITANGTAGKDDIEAVFCFFDAYGTWLADENNSITVTLSGCPSGGSSKTYFLAQRNHSYMDLGNAVTFKTGKYTSTYAIIIKSGTTVENLVFKPQLELGTTATAYTPYVPYLTAVKVSRCGKNLFDINDNSRYISYKSHTDTDIVKDGQIKPTFSISNLIEGESYTISYHTELSWAIDSSQLLWCLGTLNAEYPKGGFLQSTGNGKNSYDVKITFVAPTEKIFFFGSVNPETISNFQIENGTTFTTYEPYIGAEYTPNADGTVEGVTSLYPNTTLTTDTAGVIIDCEYNRDINKAFAALEAAIATNNS